MKTIRKKELCCGCGACAQVCPKGCIKMNRDKEGFLYPCISETACTSCGLCETVCPISETASHDDHVLGCYVGYAKDEEIRVCSSSGGIFSLFAAEVLRLGGVLYGAAVDEEQMVRHIRVDSMSGLRLLRGSKYLQSEVGDTFSEAKRDLEAGRYVLYSGTACQIAGLKSLLGEDYEKLYTVDVLCHGVPSPIVWRKYLDWQGKRCGGRVTQSFFRNKEYGWKKYAVEILFDNSKIYMKIHREDIFMQMFLENICLRPSCHECRFKDLDRVSDLTIGDAWGVDLVDSEMDDDKGTSVIITHSPKGEGLLEEILPDVRIHRTDVERILPPTADSRKSVIAHPERESFFRALNLFGTGVFTIWWLWDICKKMKSKVKKLAVH